MTHQLVMYCGAQEAFTCALSVGHALRRNWASQLKSYLLRMPFPGDPRNPWVDLRMCVLSWAMRWPLCPWMACFVLELAVFTLIEPL